MGMKCCWGCTRRDKTFQKKKKGKKKKKRKSKVEPLIQNPVVNVNEESR